MSLSGFSRNPVVTVKHSDFGPNQSIDIEQFLRSLKRDPENFSSAREGQKRRRPDRSEQRLQQRPPLSKTALPALDDDNPTKELAQLPGEGAPSERHNADNEVVGSRGNTRFPRAANERPKVRKTSYCQNQHRHRHPDLSAPLVTHPTKQKMIVVPAGVKRYKGERKHLEGSYKSKNYQNSKYDGTKREQRREILAEHVVQVDLDVSKSPLEPAYDLIESCAQIGAAPRPANQQSNGKRLSAAKPRGNNRKSCYLSKKGGIHQEDFKPLPQTPAKTELASWKLGSGFKNRAKPNVGKKKSAQSVKEKFQKPDLTQQRPPAGFIDDNLEDRAGEVQDLNNTEPRETARFMPRLSATNEHHQPISCSTTLKDLDSESTEMLQDSQRVEKTRSVFTSGLLISEQISNKGLSTNDIKSSTPAAPKPQRSMRQLRGRRRGSKNPLTHPAGIRRNRSSIIPLETWPGPSDPPISSPGKQPPLPGDKLSARSDTQSWFTSRAPPLQRGTSFVLRPRVEAKGNLDLGISPRLKRVTSLPFVPPFKAIR
ncbi:MAG: hypothetical protein LQ341_001387 [Variospora aurantia]|nr:MAG: hypothetical protein LQ341_001387 [Variospora aurantia]